MMMIMMMMGALDSIIDEYVQMCVGQNDSHLPCVQRNTCSVCVCMCVCVHKLNL